MKWRLLAKVVQIYIKSKNKKTLAFDKLNIVLRYSIVVIKITTWIDFYTAHRRQSFLI